MDLKPFDINGESSFLSKNILSNSKPVEPLAVEVKVKNERRSEVETHATCELVPAVKVESNDTSSEDIVLPAERISLYGGWSNSTDTNGRTEEEDDLDICFEKEGGAAQLDFDSCVLFENEEDVCRQDKMLINQGASEVNKNEGISLVPAVSPSATAENYYFILTECEKNRTLQAVPLVPVSEAPFSCAECGSRFKTRQILKKHLDFCHGKSASCVFCLAPFAKRLYMRPHLAPCAEKVFTCKLCSAMFKDEEHLSEHLIGHVDGRFFSCVYCSVLFSERHKLKLHLAVHIRAEPFPDVGKVLPCNFCHAVFSRSKALSDHLTVHAKSLFSCEKCTATFQEKEALLRHLTRHESETLSATPISTFSHVERHSPTRFVAKPLSDVKSASTAKRERKKQPFVLPTRKLYACVSCPAKFPEIGALETHSAFHAKRHFSCMRCPSTFKEKANFLQHLTSHSTGKRFWCPRCSAVFPRKEDLQRHIATHYSVEPIASARCDATFTDKKKLTRLVTDPLNCNALSANKRSAARSKKQKLEIISTTESAKLARNQCHTKYKSEGNLKQDSAAHSSEKLFSCAHCGASFKSAGLLLRHTITHRKSNIQDRPVFVNGQK